MESDKVPSQLPRNMKLLLHDTVLKTRWQATAGSFDHAERERLRDQERCNAFPRLGDCVDPDGEKLIGCCVLIIRNEHNFSAASIAFLCEFDAEFRSAPHRENDGDMGCVYVEIRAVLEARSCVRSGAVAAHFADAKRTHDSAAVSCAAADDLNIGGASAEFFEIAADGKDWVKIRG